VAAVVAGPVLAVSGVASAEAPAAARAAFTEVDLVSNIPGRAAVTDGHVQNAWGLALSPTSPLWVANNGTNTATLYAGGVGGATPAVVPLVVTIPGGAPTGQAFNGGSGFVVSGPGGSGPARFLFVSEAGDLVGWNPTADPTVGGQSTASLARHVDGAVYKGLTLTTTAFGSFLLAADFHHARIDVFDSSFTLIQPPAPSFTDPALPAGYAPFDVAALNGKIYVAYAQNPFIFATLVVRTQTEPMSMSTTVRKAVWTVDQDQPVWKVRTVQSLIDNSIGPRRFMMWLLGGLSTLALLLASVGLYGVMSYTVTQRTHEIGIRMALGARAADVLKLIVRNGMILVLGGILAGLAGAFVLTRWLVTLLFGVTPTDATTFVFVPLCLIVVAMLACYLPARRATKVDPLVALRYE